MAEIASNHDLYLVVSRLIAEQEANSRTLEEYLYVLWGIGLRHCDRTGFTPNEFVGMLAEAFVAEPASFTADILDNGSVDLMELERLDALGYEGWECRIARQIVDLGEMAAAGQLDNQYRGFGIDAPRGERWYNFDPCGFLECAARYSFIDGNDESAPAGAISWEQFRGFLYAGQAYE